MILNPSTNANPGTGVNGLVSLTFAEAEEMQLLKSKQRFFDQFFPNGVADGAAAHFEPRGTMSLKVTNGVGIMATTSYHILGTYSAEPLD